MKFFNKSDQLKYFMLILVPLATLYSIAGWTTISSQKHVYFSELKLVESGNLEMRTRLFETTLAAYLKDAAILSEATGEALTRTGKGEPLFEFIAAMFKAYACHHQAYDQIRYIDQSGMERLRINWDAQTGARMTREKDLQFKGNRYYFAQGRTLDQGEVYLSALDLNMEQGAIEMPIKPVIRIVLPVMTENDGRSGILVLNLLGKKLIDTLTEASHDLSGRSWLVNDKGHWLKGPNTDLEWQFMYSASPETVATKYPSLWEQMADKLQGSWQSDLGLFYYKTISLVNSQNKTRKNTLKVISKEHLIVVNHILPGRLSPPWMRPVLLLFLPEKDFDTAVLDWRRTLKKRRQAVKELAAKEKELTTIASSVRDAIVMIDGTGRALFWNTSAEALFGYPAGEVLGRDIHQFITPKEQRPEANKGLEVFSDTGEGEFIGELREVEALRKDGSRFPAELNLNSVHLDGQWRAVGVVRDISSRKIIEKRLQYGSSS